MAKPKTPTKRKKRRPKKKSAAAKAKASSGPSTVKKAVASGGGGGGVMQSMRSGFKRAAGVGDEAEKPSTASNLIWTLLLLAAVGFLLYRYYG